MKKRTRVSKISLKQNTKDPLLEEPQSCEGVPQRTHTLKMINGASNVTPKS